MVDFISGINGPNPVQNPESQSLRSHRTLLVHQMADPRAQDRANDRIQLLGHRGPEPTPPLPAELPPRLQEVRRVQRFPDNSEVRAAYGVVGDGRQKRLVRYAALAESRRGGRPMKHAARQVTHGSRHGPTQILRFRIS